MSNYTDPDRFAALVAEVPVREKGRYFEDFEPEQTIEHDAGLTLTRHANDRWTSQTLNHDPAYWRADVARDRGYDEPPIHPDYLLAAVMGCTVEDLSEKGGYFLGRDDVTLERDAVYPGTNLRVESTVRGVRESSSRPMYGIVTWETVGFDADTDEPLLSYERTNMLPRRTPDEPDGEMSGSPTTDGGTTDNTGIDPPAVVTPDGSTFQAFADALDRAGDDADVFVRHERGRTIDDVLMSTLPLSTLNTAGQHYNADKMTDSPSGEIVAYGDVTRSIALAHARSDERTVRELAYGDERFLSFVTTGDTIYGLTQVLDATPVDDDTGRVECRHYAFNQHDTPVYTGTRTALIERTT